MPNYRKPTDKETEKLNKSRKMMVEGIEGEKDLFSKISTTMAKDARDQIRAGKALRETVPASAREGEAYQDAGYKKGGKVKKMRKFEVGGFASEDEPKLSAIRKMAEIYAEKQKQKPLPADMLDSQTENQAMRKIKDTAMDAGKRLMGLTPQGRLTKSVVNMARRSPRDTEVGSSFEQETGMKKGGKVSSASKRADGCAIRGKTRA